MQKSIQKSVQKFYSKNNHEVMCVHEKRSILIFSIKISFETTGSLNEDHKNFKQFLIMSKISFVILVLVSLIDYIKCILL